MSLFGRRGSSNNEDTPPHEDENATPEAEDTPREDDEGAGESALQTRNNVARMFDTALGAGSTLEGELSSDGNVRLDGVFKGSLKIQENVLVGVTAQIEADIAAKNVSVAGVVKGDLSGKKVHLLSTAKVWGNIKAESLITEDGAFIEGHVSLNESHPSLAAPKSTDADDYDALDEGDHRL